MRTKVKISQTQFNSICRCQDICYDAMIKTSEDSKASISLNGYSEIEQQELHDVLSCIVGSIEEFFEKYGHYFE